MRRLLVLSAVLMIGATTALGGGGRALLAGNVVRMPAVSLTPGAEEMDRAIGEILRHQTFVGVRIIATAAVDNLSTLRRTLGAAYMTTMPEAQRIALRRLWVVFERFVNQQLAVGRLRADRRSPWSVIDQFRSTHTKHAAGAIGR